MAILGEEKVAWLERAAEPFIVLATEGPAGLWTWVKDQLGNLKEQVIGQVKDWVTSTIVTEGLKQVAAMLTPAGALIKAAQAIYRFVTFLVDKATEIAETVDAVLDSVESMAKGDSSTVATRVKDALVGGLPLVIGFLARLLRLDRVGDKVSEVVETVRSPVTHAVDWVITKAQSMVRGSPSDDGAPSADTLQHDDAVEAGLAETRTLERSRAGGGGLDRDDAQTIAATVRRRHPIFTKFEVVDGGDRWAYLWAASEGAAQPSTVPKKLSTFVGRVFAEARDALKNAGIPAPREAGATSHQTSQEQDRRARSTVRGIRRHHHPRESRPRGTPTTWGRVRPEEATSTFLRIPPRAGAGRRPARRGTNEAGGRRLSLDGTVAGTDRRP